MKFTYSWLKDYVDITLKPQELADKLTMAGLEVEALSQKEGEWVFEAEVTTNRPDWLSIIGIAREVATITGSSLRKVGAGAAPCGRPEKGRHRGLPLQEHNGGLKVDIRVLDAVACPRYTGRIISNIKVGPSPEWLQKRIKAIGLRPINNVVDISNFVLFETGQPLHAFDFDKLSKGKIIVRKAKEGEEIVSIDGIKRKLNSQTLIIADDKLPVAIAGIMGGKNTEVTESTKTILVESAYFNPAMIRKASKSLGLGSDSSYRFERGVDFQAVGAASDRAAALILQSAGGEAGKMADVQAKKMPPVKISVRPQKVNDLLGMDIPRKDIIRILKALGLEDARRGTARRAPTTAKLVFIAPSWRQDLKTEIDLVEEIIRIYGYEKIHVVAPKDIGVLYKENIPKELGYQTLVRDTLVSFGLDEILTYSLVKKTDDELCQEISARPRIHLKNPLSLELATLRTNLITGVLLTVKRNLNRGLNDIKVFEIGPVYLAGKVDKQEDNHLAICLSGIRTDNWQDGIRPVDFYYLKGISERLFEKIGIENYKIRLTPSIGSKIFDDTEKMKIDIIDTNGQPNEVGVFGKVKKELLEQLDIEKDCFLCQINLDAVYKYICLDKRFSQLPKFPAIYRDISTLVRQEISSGEIVNLIKETAGVIVKDIKLFDVYRGQQIPKGHKSLIYRLTYQSPDKTLTDAEVETVHSKITFLLKEKLGVQIR